MIKIMLYATGMSFYGSIFMKLNYLCDFSCFSYKMNKHKRKTIIVAEDTHYALEAFCEGRSIRHVPDLF